MPMDINRQTTMPIETVRSNRNHMVSVLTSMPAGVMVPLAAIPMLREDSLSASLQVAVEMLETKEILANPVNLRVTAYVVPWLAFERFEGSRDQFDRSYMGQPKVDGGAVVPFIETQAMGTYGANAVYKYLGLHAKSTDLVNTAYLEAYNQIWNFRAKNRSKQITPRARLATTLAPAFWNHSRFEHILPDFDQARIDGEIALNVVASQLALKKAGVTAGNIPVNSNAAAPNVSGGGLTNSALRVVSGSSLLQVQSNAGSTANVVWGNESGLVASLTGVTAEMSASGVTISLSNLELARKTQAFAKLRERFNGLSDEWIIDMLMDGLAIPDQALKQPILIADQITRITQAKRYATNAPNLAESAVSGGGMVNVNLRVPRLQTGGVVMVMVEAVPEQLFERQRDPFLFAANTAALPEYLSDFLDPEKVDVITNGEIDTDHATPAGVFGYAPMNWKWNAAGPKVGGKFYRPTTNTSTDTVRQRLWAVENVNPTLSSDFYLVNNIHIKPFLDTAVDPFEAAVAGNAVLNGNTVFGGMLVEGTNADNDYDKVIAQVDQSRIVKA